MVLCLNFCLLTGKQYSHCPNTCPLTCMAAAAFGGHCFCSMCHTDGINHCAWKCLFILVVMVCVCFFVFVFGGGGGGGGEHCFTALLQ